MSSENDAKPWDVNAFFDTDPFWVIWQVGRSPRGERRIRRITQNYGSAALANADAERFRKSGVVTWVEEARPLKPLDIPQAAIEALKDFNSGTGERSRDRAGGRLVGLPEGIPTIWHILGFR